MSANIDTSKIYRLTTQFMESKGVWLEGNGGLDPKCTLGGAAFLSSQNPAPSGTFWKFVDAGNGYYRMTTRFMESKGVWLEGNGGLDPKCTLGGAAFLSSQNPAPSGTFWKFVDAGNGYYRMTTQFMESKGVWFEGNGGYDSKCTLGGAAFLSSQNPAPTGTFWKLVPAS